MSRRYPRHRETSRSVKLRIMRGALVLLPGRPRIPWYLSAFERKRLKRALAVCELYYRRGFDTDEIAAFMPRCWDTCPGIKRPNLSHQMVSVILKHGTQHLFKAGWLKRPGELAEEVIQAVLRRATPVA